MSRRLLAAALAVLLPAAGARAQEKQDEVDAKTRAAIERAVEKAKDDIRNEVRAEMQGAQSAAEFLGAVAEGPKLEFLEVDGYYRFRGQLLSSLDLRAGRDAEGRYLFPISRAGQGGSSLATANMRLRVEPTLNVSEHVRVRAQIDVLDNHVLGSSTSGLFDDPNSPYPVPFYGSTRLVSSDPALQARLDRPTISPKRAWAEIQTPVGLLSFGRMPSHWGLGVLTSSGAGIDEDFGDTVDRIQFALPSASTPIGRLTLVPILDFHNEGTLYADPRTGPGQGQPFDAAKGDDARSLSLKVARLDTEDEVRRKAERNEASVNYGVYYSYRTQRYFYPEDSSFDPALTSSVAPPPETIHRAAYAHVADFWWRLLTARWRIEAEVVGVYGSIGDPRSATNDPAQPPVPKVLLRQWGGAAVVEYKVSPNRFMLGGEAGAASGDPAPGFGNVPRLGPSDYGALEGAQWSGAGDRTIRNFRFNPAYRVDLILFHQILGQVTDALYVKPKLRWDLLPGLFLDAQVVYSRALEKRSTPSVAADGSGGSANLGIEVDGMLSYAAGDGFQAWVQYGILQPMSGLAPHDRSLRRAQALAVGLAAKF